MTENIVRHKYAQSVMYLGVVAILYTSSIVLNQRMIGHRFQTPPDTVNIYQVFDPLVHRVFSFGHLSVLVDTLWIRSIIDNDLSRYTEQTGHSNQFYLFKLITELDPSFFTAYWVGANLLAIVRDDPKGAVIILQKAMDFLRETYPSTSLDFRNRHWPAPWYIPFYLGYVYLFELNDLQKAAEVLKELSKYPNTPFVWANVAKKLEKPEGIYDLGITYVNHLARTAQSQEVAESYLKRKKDLILSRHLFLLNYEFDQFKKTRSHSRNLFGQFVQSKGISLVDPYGGEISLNSDGKIVSTTERQKVLGLE